MGERCAVVLFNLGGPDSLEAVEPFLESLFGDPAILSVPGPVRRPLARFIARRRARTAREIYARLGGRSPLLELSQAQAAALEARLGERMPGSQAKVFLVMRHWKPRARETLEAVKAFAPARIVALPLYPQYSTTTTASSLAEFREEAALAGIDAPVHEICCYPQEEDFLAAHARLIAETLDGLTGTLRILFSAHGLPEQVVKRGDPYQWQVERTVAALVEHLTPRLGEGLFEWRIGYQSRVGPLKWIGPSTESEIVAAGKARRTLVVVPIAFVSEHSETLVELDIEYRALAEKCGVETFRRVPALGAAPEFIAALAGMVEEALARGPGLAPAAGRRICPGHRTACPCPAVSGTLAVARAERASA